MKLSVVSFTENGRRLSEKIALMLQNDSPAGQGDEMEIKACLYTKCKASAGKIGEIGKIETKAQFPISFVETSIAEWAKEQMQERNAMLFIGACGIAVRAIAPSLTNKLQDAPVLVMGEDGKYIIPVLSGHMGGANELANVIAQKTGAQPVITTATDLNQKFAVDLFAKQKGLSIVNKDGIVKVSSKILNGEQVTMSIEPGNVRDEKMISIGGLPDDIKLVSYPPVEAVDIVVSSEHRSFDTAVLLRPKEYIIGLGCRRGKSAKELGHFIQKRFEAFGICTEQVFALASISQKKDEQGIIEWCQKERIPFFTYTAGQLQEVKGNFNGSSFVKSQVGVDNVCERAALKACEGRGELIASKYAEDGMTIAIVKRDWRACLYGK